MISRQLSLIFHFFTRSGKLIVQMSFFSSGTPHFELNLDFGQNKKDPKKGMVGEKFISLNGRNPRDIKGTLEV